MLGWKWLRTVELFCKWHCATMCVFSVYGTHKSKTKMAPWWPEQMVRSNYHEAALSVYNFIFWYFTKCLIWFWYIYDIISNLISARMHTVKRQKLGSDQAPTSLLCRSVWFQILFLSGSVAFSNLHSHGSAYRSDLSLQGADTCFAGVPEMQTHSSWIQCPKRRVVTSSVPQTASDYGAFGTEALEIILLSYCLVTV